MISLEKIGAEAAKNLWVKIRLPQGAMRHKDHRFEWTRQQFADWAQKVARRFGYAVRIDGLGPQDPTVGSPSQMGVFTQHVG
jgi:hypothetical protein